MTQHCRALHNDLLLSGPAVLSLWRLLNAVGDKLPPDLRPVMDEAWQVACNHLRNVTTPRSAPGHEYRTSPDMQSRSTHDPDTRTARQIGERCGVTDRHVRRIAQRYNIEPAAEEPRRWDAAGQAQIRAHLTHL